jgi:hypothetical protein
LNGLDLLSRFSTRGEGFSKAVEWIWSQREADGLWEDKPSLSDPIWFPLSEDWRRVPRRRIDLGVRSLLCLQKLV